jgi:precorrin-3B methylase
MPSSEIPYRIATGEVSIGVGDTKFMLPVSKAPELTSASQKACACGIYLTDYNVLKAMGQNTEKLETVLARLTSDLNITFVMAILNESAPGNASKEEFAKFLQNREDQILQAMIDNDKIDVQIEMLSGIAAETACVYANPSLVIKGDATTAGLSDNLMKRLETLNEITADLTAYYPDLKELGETISPLKDKVSSIQTARSANTEITAIRDALLK